MKRISFETGVILPVSEIKLGTNTPIKLYIDDLAAILELPIGTSSLLFELFQTIDAEGTIILNRTRKTEILEKLSITIGTIDNYLSMLVKAGVLKRRFRSSFQANPYLFDRVATFRVATESASETESPELLETMAFKMEIAYNFSGKRKISLIFPED